MDRGSMRTVHVGINACWQCMLSVHAGSACWQCMLALHAGSACRQQCMISVSASAVVCAIVGGAGGPYHLGAMQAHHKDTLPHQKSTPRRDLPISARCRRQRRRPERAHTGRLEGAPARAAAPRAVDGPAELRRAAGARLRSSWHASVAHSAAHDTTRSMLT